MDNALPFSSARAFSKAFWGTRNGSLADGAPPPQSHGLVQQSAEVRSGLIQSLANYALGFKIAGPGRSSGCRRLSDDPSSPGMLARVRD